MVETNCGADLVGAILAEAGYDSRYDVPLDDPKFSEAGRVHDWRNYVSNELRRLWPGLSDEARAIAYLMAEQQSNSENWE